MESALVFPALSSFLDSIESSIVRIEDESEGRMKRLRIHFKNGYGASIIRGYGIFSSFGVREGLYELGVLRGSSLCYTTPLTDDVLGDLNASEIECLCKRIAQLPPE